MLISNFQHTSSSSIVYVSFSKQRQLPFWHGSLHPHHVVQRGLNYSKGTIGDCHDTGERVSLFRIRVGKKLDTRHVYIPSDRVHKPIGAPLCHRVSTVSHLEPRGFRLYLQLFLTSLLTCLVNRCVAPFSVGMLWVSTDCHAEAVQSIYGKLGILSLSYNFV